MPQPTSAMRSLHILSSPAGGRVESYQIEVCERVSVCVYAHVWTGVECRLSVEQGFVLCHHVCFTVCACDFVSIQHICT